MMTQIVTLLGAKRSKGKLDDGKVYDSTKIYVQTKMNESDDTVGFAVSEYNWGDSSNFETIKSVSYPCQAEVVFEMATNGKTTKLVVTGVKPIKKV